MKERATGVPPVNANQQHEQDARATMHKRRGAYLPHWKPVALAVGEMARAMALVHPQYLAGKGWGEPARALLRKHRSVVTK